MSLVVSRRWADISPKAQELMVKVHSLLSAVLNQDKLQPAESQARMVL